MVTLEQSLDTIRRILTSRSESLAVAESVTAGNFQAALSLAEDATYFFQGGLTAYNLGQKARHLHVDPIAAEGCNCVSSNIASVMATRAAEMFSSDWAIGITGYAAPVPDWQVENVLFAYFAVSYKGKVVYENKIKTSIEPMKKVQELYVQEVLKEFAAYLTDLI